MDVLEAIRGRRAVRDYLDDPVDAGAIEAVLENAVWAPSGMNRQPWRFLVLQGRELLARCSAEAKAEMLAQAAERPELAGVSDMLGQADFNIFYNAPALIVVCATQPDEMALKDCCLAAENLMLAAHAAGLGTCWIGFAEAWLKTPRARSRLGLSDDMLPVAPIIIGRPRGETHAPQRRPAEVRFVQA